MKFSIISLFPESLYSYLNESIVGRAIKNKFIKVDVLNPRDYTLDRHHKADDRPYGGGPGMVMYAMPILSAIKKSLPKKIGKKKTKVIIFSPSGTNFTNSYARNLIKKYAGAILVSGKYEGIDARVKKILKTDSWFKERVSVEEVSIGDFVLSGGELPALVVVDVTARQIDGVLGHKESLEEKRVASPEFYTRPETIVFNKKKYNVPKTLLSGNHKEIEEWKKRR